MSSEPIERREAARGRRARWVEVAVIAALALTLDLIGNGRIGLWDRDEPRYAVCTREMAARGEWVFPTFNDEPRYQKPVLIYWLMRAGYAVGGDNPFGARLVSAVAGTATCLLVLALGRRMLGPRAAFLGALMLTTAPIMVIESKLATTDATLALLLVGCQFCLWELGLRPSRALAATFWVLTALATLTKGPVGLAMLACSGLVNWGCGGPTSAWSRLHWRWGVPLYALVTSPWFVAVGIRSHGDFFRVAIGEQVATRIVSGMEQHGGFPGYYLVTSLLTFHPWSALVPAAVLAAWSSRRQSPALGFLLGWVVGPLILLECVKTKLIHYYLPAFPACALLTGWLVENVARDGVNLRRWPLGRLGLGVIGGVGVGITAVLMTGSVMTPAALRWPFLAAALVVGAGTVGALRYLYRAATEKGAYVLAGTWALAVLVFSGWLLPSAEPYRTSQVIGLKLARIVEGRGVHPVLLAFQEPSVIYAMKRSAPLIRTWERLYREIDRHGEVVTAITVPKESVEFDKRPELEVEVLETVRDFNMNKGATQTLHLALIRRRATAVPDPIAGTHVDHLTIK